MRLEVGGAQITEGVAEVMETLQTQPEILKAYRRTVSVLSRRLILSPDDDDDVETMAHLRALRMMIRDLETIANPPRADDIENDNPVVSL
jgi:hypothetical protein